MGHAQRRTTGEGAVMNQQGVEYQYGGQWFDDMGALALTFPHAPALGVSLATANMPRIHTNDMAKNLFGAQVDPYNDGGGQGI